MRKFIFIIFMIICKSNLLYAQDTITLLSGEEISAKVLEVTPIEIKYKKNNNQEGPIYTIEKRDVFMITYENGSKDLFNQDMSYMNQQHPTILSPKKSPGLAWFLSFLVPGVGQFYNGDVSTGIGFMTLNIAGSIFMVVGASVENINTNTVGAVLVLSSRITAQIDAPIGAHKKNLANGYLSWNLGKDTHLSLQPEFKLASVPIEQNMSLVPTCGVGLTLNFR